MNLSKHQLDKFKSDPVWKFIQGYIEDVINDIYSNLETEENTTTLYRLQGELSAYKRVLALPNVIESEIKLKERLK